MSWLSFLKSAHPLQFRISISFHHSRRLVWFIYIYKPELIYTFTTGCRVDVLTLPVPLIFLQLISQPLIVHSVRLDNKVISGSLPVTSLRSEYTWNHGNVAIRLLAVVRCYKNNPQKSLLVRAFACMYFNSKFALMLYWTCFNFIYFSLMMVFEMVWLFCCCYWWQCLDWKYLLKWARSSLFSPVWVHIAHSVVV